MDYIDKIERLDKYIKENLSQKRYLHSVKVAEMSRRIAVKFNIDLDRAYFAGLTHDIARELKIDFQEKIIENFTDLSNEFISLQQLYHGPVGAYLLEEEFNVNDIEVLEAVKYHSVGCRGMSKLAKCVFVADYISEDRKHISSSFRDRVLCLGLDEMVYHVLLETRSYLSNKGKKITKESIDLLEEVYNEKK